MLSKKWANLKHSQFSRTNLAIVTLVIASIGGYFLLTSSAITSSIGDVNNDGQINITDLSTLLSNYGTSNSSTDFNNDGSTSIVDLSILLSHYGTVVSTPPSTSFASVYGTPYSPSSLSNIRVGDVNQYSPAYRFKADHTGNLQGFRLYWVDGSGYAAGNGGTLQMTIQSDDGSANHFPSGTVLGQPIVYHPNLVNGIDPGGNPSLFQFFTLPAAVPVVEGQIYHLVFANTDANSSQNWHSVDALSAVAPGNSGGLTLIDSVQSGIDRTDWGTSFKYSGSSGWVNLSPGTGGESDFSPILDLKWTDGHHLGNGYMEVWIGKPVTLTASGAAREQFTPSTTKTINKINVEAITTTAGSLTARLETSAGALIQQGTTSTTGDGKGHWFSFNIPSTTLTAGQPYNLVWLTPSGSAKVFAIRDGNRSPFNFDAVTTFSDGRAQQFKSGSWQNWEDAWSTSPVDYADLSFYFSVVN